MERVRGKVGERVAGGELGQQEGDVGHDDHAGPSQQRPAAGDGGDRGHHPGGDEQDRGDGVEADEDGPGVPGHDPGRGNGQERGDDDPAGGLEEPPAIGPGQGSARWRSATTRSRVGTLNVT